MRQVCSDLLSEEYMDRQRSDGVVRKNFNDHIKEWCGPKAKVLLMTDNLDAQVFDDKKDILSKDGRVVGLLWLCYGWILVCYGRVMGVLWVYYG